MCALQCCVNAFIILTFAILTCSAVFAGSNREALLVAPTTLCLLVAYVMMRTYGAVLSTGTIPFIPVV